MRNTHSRALAPNHRFTVRMQVDRLVAPEAMSPIAIPSRWTTTSIGSTGMFRDE